MARVPSPVAVARSSLRNQRAASFVMAPRISGCPMAIPTWETKTSARLSANSPRVTPNTAVSAAPRETAPRIPHESMSQAAGSTRRMYTTMNTMERRPMVSSEVA